MTPKGDGICGKRGEIYEDNHIIVAYKEKGILSQADGSDKPDMLTILKDYIKEKYNKPGNVYLGLVHRLDINTSGVMVFARTSKAASRLSESIKNNKLNKKYYCIVEGTIKEDGSLIDKIAKDEVNKKRDINSSTKSYSITLGHHRPKQLVVSSYQPPPSGA